MSPGRWVTRATVLGGLGALLAGAALLAAWRGPYLRIDGAVVTGNERVAADALYEASGLHGRWSPAAGAAEARSRILALDGIADARVRVAWPALVTIAVEETQVLLAWQTAGVAVGVDERGLAVTPPAESASLVTVRDGIGLLARPGDRLATGLLEAALAFGARLGPLELTAQEGFVAATRDGWRVRLGTDATQADAQLAALEALAVSLGGHAAAVELVDLRFPSRPYYRLRQGAVGR